ncbi:MAG: enoyl-CoA hydratase/isomerase family protein [Hyphomicrobiaceae bacterium]
MASAVLSRFTTNRSFDALPGMTGQFDTDVSVCSSFWAELAAQLDQLPAKPDRSEAQAATASSILALARKARNLFLSRHVGTLYAQLTKDFTVKRRIEDIVTDAAVRVPGLVPDNQTLEREAQRDQKDKEGHEIDHGLLLNAILADQKCGLDLCHAMLLPKSTSLELAEEFSRTGYMDLGTAVIERSGKVATLSFNNPSHLHAEDESTLQQVESGVDLALLDPATEITILRGSKLNAGKYAGKRVTNTGINLTHLYRGKISYLWYIIRDMGFINKMYRGLAYPDQPPTEMNGDTLEKPWIGTVEQFAIGGGCQYLLVTDFVVAEERAYLTLPARKEGIIPGVANMRLPRFVGDRIARQAIQYDRRIDCDSEEGRMICDLVVPSDQFDNALYEVAERLTNSGVVSAASNRRAFRVAEEPLDKFRQYMSLYSREQAYCHFSSALIRNLEQFWNAKNRRVHNV